MDDTVNRVTLWLEFETPTMLECMVQAVEPGVSAGGWTHKIEGRRLYLTMPSEDADWFVRRIRDAFGDRVVLVSTSGGDA